MRNTSWSKTHPLLSNHGNQKTYERNFQHHNIQPSGASTQKHLYRNIKADQMSQIRQIFADVGAIDHLLSTSSHTALINFKTEASACKALSSLRVSLHPLTTSSATALAPLEWGLRLAGLCAWQGLRRGPRRLVRVQSHCRLFVTLLVLRR